MAAVSARIRSRARCEYEDSATLGGAARLRAAMPASADTPGDLAIPTLDVRSLARRAAVPAVLAAVAAAAIVIAGGPLRAFADALGRALDADPRWVGAAAVFELLSFVGYVALLWLVGSRASDRLGFRASTQITLGGAAATRLLPTGGVGGAALTLWALRRAGLGTRGATSTLLVFLVVLYAVFPGAIAVAGGAIALGIAHADGPLALGAAPAAAAIVAITAGLALAAFARTFATEAPPAPSGTAPSFVAKVRAAVGDTPAALGTAIRDAMRLVRTGDPPVRHGGRRPVAARAPRAARGRPARRGRARRDRERGRRDARPRGRADGPVRDARAVDLRAGRGACLRRDGCVHRAARA